MDETNFKDINYLKKRNKKQKRAYHVLNELKIFEVLEKYNPTLVGTIPLDIDIKGSDLDIICEVYDLNKFEKTIL